MTVHKTISGVLFGLSAVCLALCFAGAAQAAARTWQGGSGDWFNVGSPGWDALPTSSDTATIASTGATVSLSGSGEASILTLGLSTWEGHLVINSGSLTVGADAGGDVVVGEGAYGSLVVSGGTVTGNGNLWVGYGQRGVVRQSGGTMQFGDTWIGQSNFDNHLELSGNASFSTNVLFVGYGEQATLTLSGSNVQLVASGDVTIGDSSGPDTLAYEIDAGGVSTMEAGGAGKNVTLANSPILDISLLAAPPSADLVLIDNKGSNAVSGTFGSLPEGATVQATFGPTTYEWEITYVYDQGGYDGNDIALVLIPEPSTLLLATFGVLGVALYGWRKRRGPNVTA